ncbi:MAG TPA: PH domain-containing protein [Xanthomonadales bacterium]|nr:PH domain-containing protein [Xanthomonadales bacterium]
MSEVKAVYSADSFDADAPGGESYALHPRVRTLWRLQALLLAAVVVLPGSIPVAVFAGRYGLLLSLAVALAVVVGSELHRRAYLKTFRCVLLPDGLLLKRGVLWQTETFVPRPRIQHTDVHEGPVARHFGIATLKVFTAGTHVGQLQVEGLPRESALALRDRLLGRDGHDAV